MRILILLLLVTAQSGPFLVSTAETSKGGVQAFVKEDSAGARQLQIYVPAGGNIGRDPDRIPIEDVTARAFDEAGKEMGLTPSRLSVYEGTLLAVCNAGSCSAIKIYSFSASKAETDRVRKVVVMFREKQYELIMEKYPQAKPAP